MSHKMIFQCIGALTFFLSFVAPTLSNSHDIFKRNLSPKKRYSDFSGEYDHEWSPTLNTDADIYKPYADFSGEYDHEWSPTLNTDADIYKPYADFSGEYDHEWSPTLNTDADIYKPYADFSGEYDHEWSPTLNTDADIYKPYADFSEEYERWLSPTINKDAHVYNDEANVEPISYVRRTLSARPMFRRHHRPGVKTKKTLHATPTDRAAMKINSLLPHLHAAVTFRDNIIFVFSYLLHGHKDVLSEQQYSALQLIYDLLRKKRVYTFNMLPIVSTLEGMDKNKQMQTILMAMKKNLPVYVHCAATYLSEEIARGKMNLNVLLRSTALEVFDFLDNLDISTIGVCELEACRQDIEALDPDSKVTMDSMGPVFVHIQRQIESKKLPITQELFGLILMNLPNPDGDPVLDEYVRYIYDVTRHHLLTVWVTTDDTSAVSKERRIDTSSLKGLYKHVILDILRNLPNEQVPWVVKHALIYIQMHLKPVPATIANPTFEQIYAITKNGIDLFTLFTSIATPEFSPDAKHLSDILLTFFDKNVENKDLDDVFNFNRFTYPDPLDLLLALLTRVKTRTAPSNIELIRPARALLAALIFKKDARVFSTDMSSAVEVPSLLDILKAQHLGPIVTGIADLLMERIFELPYLVPQINAKMPHSKEFCRAPRQCLLATMNNIRKAQSVPNVLLASMKQLIPYVMSEIDSNVYNIEKLSNKPSVLNRHDTDENNPLIKRPHETVRPLKAVGSVPTENPKVIALKPKKKKEGISLGSRSEAVDSEASSESVELKPHSIHEPQSHVRPRPKHHWSHPTRKPPSKSVTDVDSLETQSYERTTEATGKPKIPMPTDTVIHKQPPKKTSQVSGTTMNPTESTEETQLKPKNKVPSGNRPTAILPPSIEPNKTIHIDVSDNGVTVITTNWHQTSKPSISVPPVSTLLTRPDPDKPLQNLGSHVEKKILHPLELIFGKRYVEKIIGSRERIKQYPTNIALLIDLLEGARKDPKVMRNKELLANIRTFIVNLEYVAVTVLLPVVVTSEDITSDVVYSTFNPSNPSSTVLSNVPPQQQSHGTITIALTNPKQWLESVNSTDPYSGLIPNLPRGDPNEVKLRPLKMILTQTKIISLLGKSFNPHLYPTKGALLVTLLEKLLHVDEVKQNPQLKILIEEYLKALALPSMYTSVPINVIMNTVTTPSGKWQPELTSLMQCLPPPMTAHQFRMMQILHEFLRTPNLLERLGLPMPSMMTTRGELLKAIMKTALRSTNITLSESQTAVFKYYKDKIAQVGPGALPVLWAWVHVYVLKTEVKLGKLIENTIDFDKLPYKKKLAYNELVLYFSEHPELLQSNQQFEFETYKTQGEFLKGLFRHLLSKKDISRTAKKDIKLLLPYIKLTGLGAIEIPTSVQTIIQNK